MSNEGQRSVHLSGMYLLNIVVGERATIFELFAGEDQTLLIGWDAFLVLDLALDIVDRIGGFDLEGDSLAREGLDEAAQWGLEIGVGVAEGSRGKLRVGGKAYICTVD